jgi:hypothetical protein
MAIDWDAISVIVDEQLQADENDILTKRQEFPHGGAKDKFSFLDLAKLQTLSRNDASILDKQQHGFLNLVERDFD